jgi:lauroyl/myristoyl acyltransferase
MTGRQQVLEQRDILTMRLLKTKDLYWLCVILMIRGAGWIPWWRVRQAIASSAGWLGYAALAKWRKRTAEHLAAAFHDQLSAQQVDQITRECFREYWREALSLLPTAGDRALLRQAEIQGWQHLEKALADGKGVILWEASVFGSRNASKWILRDKGISVHQVHAQNHIGWEGLDPDAASWLSDHVIAGVFRRWMRRFVASIIWLPETESLAFARVLLDLLEHNGIVCSTADGESGQRLASVELLGHKRRFATGMPSLAKLSGAALLPLFCIQDRHGIPTLMIGPPIALNAHADRQTVLESCVAQWVTLLESHVRANPGKYRGWFTHSEAEAQR